jgi:K(+)-stimulated pyrophosphate-energized sodium pump
MKLMENVFRRRLPLALALLLSIVASPLAVSRIHAQASLAAAAPAAAPSLVQEHQGGGEANLIIPDLKNQTVPVAFFGMSGHQLLMGGLVVCALGLIFGLVIFTQLKNMAVHQSMREVSELIYETCKTYLITQGKFILILEIFIGLVIALYFGVLVGFPAIKVIIILLFSLIGIAGSYGVAWFGIRVNTFANSRAAFASLRGKPYPCYSIPLSAGMSIGMLLISVELVLMLGILLFIPGDYAGPCFIGFAIGESLGACAPPEAGGHLSKIAPQRTTSI